MSKQIKKVTLDSLGITVNNLSDKVDKLALVVENGFKDTRAGFRKVNEDIEALARMTARGFSSSESRFQGLEQQFAGLEQGQENIQLRVDSLAPQFEVKGLERRVKRLEDKAGIHHT